MGRKGLVMTNRLKGVEDLLSSIDSNLDEVRTIFSFGGDISHPYGCTMRNILISIFQGNIDVIYIVLDTRLMENFLTKEDLKSKITCAGISDETIKTIEFTNAAGNDVYAWLQGTSDAATKIKKNIELIQRHPLLPKGFPVHGVLVNEGIEIICS